MAFPDLPWLEFGDHLRINLRSEAEALALIADRLERGAGFTIATLNLDHAVQLETSEAFRTAYATHTHVTADGEPVAWLARKVDAGVERVAGSDLVEPCVRIAARLNAPIALIGAADTTVLDRARTALQERYPDLRCTLERSPSFPFDPTGAEADALISDVRASGARLVLLALGAPRQEILASRMASACPDIGIISVGAGIDFIAGTVRRAPRIFRAFNIEWAWRLMMEPVRLGPRYWRCLRLLPRLMAQANRRA